MEEKADDTLNSTTPLRGVGNNITIFDYIWPHNKFIQADILFNYIVFMF